MVEVANSAQGPIPVVANPVRICPLLLAAVIAQGSTNQDDASCRQGNCEWWTVRKVYIEDLESTEEIEACGLSFVSLYNVQRVRLP